MQFAGCGTISTQLIFASFTPDKKEALGEKSAKCSECGRTFPIDWKDDA